MSNNKSLEEQNNIALMHFLAKGGDIDNYVPLTKQDLPKIIPSPSPVSKLEVSNSQPNVVTGNLVNLFAQNNADLAPIIAAPIPTVSPQQETGVLRPILAHNSQPSNLPFALKDVPYESLPSLCGHILANREGLSNLSYYNSADDEQGILCKRFLDFWDSLDEVVSKNAFKPFLSGRFEITFLTFCQMIHSMPEGCSVYTVYNNLKVFPAKWAQEDKLNMKKDKPKINALVKELRKERDLKVAELDMEVRDSYFKFIEASQRRNSYKKEMLAKIEAAKLAENGELNGN